MSDLRPEELRAARHRVLAVLLTAAAVACAKTDDEWREDLASADPFVRGMAAIGLSVQTPHEAAAAVPELLQMIDGVDVGLEREGAEVLFGVALFHAPLLLDHLVDEDLMSETRRRTILGALAAAGPASTGPIVTTLRGRGGHLAGDLGQVLLATGEPALPAIVELLEHAEDVRLRNYAAFLLASIGPRARSALPALRAAAASPDPELRAIASEAINSVEGRPWRVPSRGESKR